VARSLAEMRIQARRAMAAINVPFRDVTSVEPAKLATPREAFSRALALLRDQVRGKEDAELTTAVNKAVELEQAFKKTQRSMASLSEWLTPARKSFTERSSEWMVAGSPAATMNAYNALLQALTAVGTRDSDNLGCHTELLAVRPPEPLPGPARWD
jgi:hypothetical protein